MADSFRCGWAVGLGAADDGEDVVMLAVDREIIGMSIASAEQMAKQLLLLVDYLRAKGQEADHG